MKAKTNNNGMKPIEQPKEQPQSASIETIEQAAEKAYYDWQRKIIGDDEWIELEGGLENVLMPIGLTCYKKGVEFALNWQQHQSNQQVIENTVQKTLEYVIENGDAQAIRDDGHRIYELVFNEKQILSLKNDIVKSIESVDNWIEVDIESENYPADFQECWLLHIENKVYRGYLIKYGDDLANAEWSIPEDSSSFDFDGITHYIEIKMPNPPIKN